MSYAEILVLSDDSEEGLTCERIAHAIAAAEVACLEAEIVTPLCASLGSEGIGGIT